MFKWLFKKQIKEEVDDNLKKLNFHLANSFMNVKRDMDSFNIEVSTSKEKFSQIEYRLKFIENQILMLLQQKTPKIVEESRELPSPERLLDKPEMVLDDLTYTQKTLLRTLYEYQIKLNSPISIKSIAKILYPDKKLSQVRTTITEYLDVLASYNLIIKTRKRRQSYAQVTENGFSLIQDILKSEPKLLKKKQKVN